MCRVSGLTDHQAVSSCLDDLDRDNLGVVNAEDAFNLGEQPCENSQVAAGQSDQARDDLGGEAAVWAGHARRRPASFQKIFDLRSAKRPELMNEADTRVERREASDALLDTGMRRT